MDADVLAEFECVCAESRRMLRNSCTDCDLCFYFKSIDVERMAESNPWSFFEKNFDLGETVEEEYHTEIATGLGIYENPDLIMPTPRYASPVQVPAPLSLVPKFPDSFDDSLIVPDNIDEDLDASIARRKAAINEKLFRIGIVPGWTDPVSTYGAYESNRKETVKHQPPPPPPLSVKRTLSLMRPRRSLTARPISGISMDLYDQLADLPTEEDDSSMPETPELESPNSLNRVSTITSEGSLSEEELEFPEAGGYNDPVIRRISGPEQLNEFSELYPEPLKVSRKFSMSSSDFSAEAMAELKDLAYRRRRLLKRSRPTIHL